MIKKLFSLLLLLSCVATAFAQTTSNHSVAQTAVNNLVSLPEADALVYVSPQRIFNDAAPKVMPAADLVKLRDSFADIKKAVGVDPARIDSLVVAIRFHKPSGDLSFVLPELLAVVSGDFSADSLLTTARLYMEDRARDEKYGTRTLTLITLDPVIEAAKQNAILKPLSEIAVAALGTSTLAIGNVSFVKAAIDASEGKNRINVSAITSLMRDPNAMISATGSPLTAFAKSFGLRGTETAAREARCDTKFGDFYAAVTMEGSDFYLRGAMNADNPDTAKIINGLLSGLLLQAAASVPDKNAQSILKGLKMTPTEDEVVIEASIPGQVVADFIRTQPASTPPKQMPGKSKKAPVRRKVIRH